MEEIPGLNEITDEPRSPKPPKAEAAPQHGPASGSAPPATGTAAGFDFNRPTIINLLYLAAPLLFVSGIVGVVLAYVWKGEAHEGWEDSHYTYLIRTFWIGLIGSVIGFGLMIVLIGFLVLPLVAVLVVVRSVLSLINAQKKQAMPNPETWLA